MADVRIRLSVDGEAQVIAAMRKVLAESKRSGDAASESFTSFGSALVGIRNTLASIGIAVGVTAVVASLKSLVTSAVQSAEEMGHFAEIIGTIVANAQALTLAAARTDVDLEKLQRGMIKFNTSLQEFKAGGGEASAAFRALGIGIKEIEGKDTAEAFDVLASHMAQFRDSGEKTNAFVKLTGVRLVTLLPLVNKLGKEGLAGLREEAERLGLVFDEQLVFGANNLQHEFKVLDLQVKALATRFLGGLAPNAIAALQQIEGELGSNANAWEKWGDRLGLVFAGVLFSISNIVDSVIGATKIALIDAEALAKIGLAIVSKNVQGIGVFAAIAKVEEKAVMDAHDRLVAEHQKTLDDLKAGKKPQFGPPVPTADPSALFDDMERQTARAEALFKVQQAEFRARETLNKALLDRSLISLRDYFKERFAILDAEYLAEKDLLAKRLEIARQEPDQKKRDAAKSKIVADQTVLETKHASDVKAALLDQGAERQKLVKAIGAGLAKEEAARGDSHEQVMRQIREETLEYERNLSRRGDLSAAEVDRMVAQHKAAAVAVAEFDQAALAGRREMTILSLATDAIQQRVDAGLLSQIEGEKLILDLKRQQLPSIVAAAEAQYQLALNTKNPDLINDALAHLNAVNAVSLALEAQGDVVARLKATFIDSGTSALTTFFSTGITQSKHLSDAFHEMAVSIIRDIQAMASKLLATQIVTGFLGLFGGAAPTEGGRQTIPNPTIPSKESGGFLDGIGPQLIEAHGGEYVVKASAVRVPGMLTHLQTLNRGMVSPALRSPGSLHKFAEGGLVGSTVGAAGPSGTVTVGLEDGLVLRAMESDAGERLIVRHVNKNRRALGLR